MNSKDYENLPLVYSCSGCSNAAQLANDIAVKLDQEKIAEMSCIAGVGGGVRPLVKTAKSNREIIVLDGCPLTCAKHCLENQQVPITQHIDISKLGVKKKYHEKCNQETSSRVWNEVLEIIKNKITSDS